MRTELYVNYSISREPKKMTYSDKFGHLTLSITITNVEQKTEMVRSDHTLNTWETTDP
jgi:hypothetical protein